ncbi:ATP-binding cassette domain-containing protein [Legionella saoudiensis]|uniref:ATP-binding cassette domain-containing protein n=1 Tax=Legionella saoudiensis TaxID=1750561 RepID=UPI000730B51C|nr:ATP-binding cassette domain-containing protein [Legionella saoudiensis]
MMHKPIQFESLSLSFSHKTCFSDFSGQITSGSRIAIIGRNGSGKSSLLNLFAGLETAVEGTLCMPKDLSHGYIPQIVDVFDSLSGGQCFNKLLTQALAHAPELLLLDEPTNHLDSYNRRSLMRMLSNFSGTLIMVTHDIELLQNTVDTIWHIAQNQIHVFSGCYDDYMREQAIQRTALENEISHLVREKKQMHANLMKEQARAKSSRQLGEKQLHQKKWPTLVSGTKVRNAQETSGRKKQALNHKRQELTERLTELHVEEIITPKFILRGQPTNQALITISEGSVRYATTSTILQNLNFVIKGHERVAIQGNNGSGKSTLIKALLTMPSLVRTGMWLLPPAKEIGYLDQHYHNLNKGNTVWQTLSCVLPNRSYTEIRRHLNDFLFRKNEEVEALVETLSGGEKARLSLAQIAAISPKLLILDEITNNLDRETRAHIIQILNAYPGALIVISHDSDFLAEIGITTSYEIRDGLLK